MIIELRERTEKHVRIQYEKIREPEIWAMIPMTDKTLEQAIADYEKTLLPGASSFGQTIYVDGAYVGDIWNTMLTRERTRLQRRHVWSSLSLWKWSRGARSPTMRRCAC